MATRNELQISRLQRNCVIALRLHADLAEATCEILFKTRTAPLTARDRARLSHLRRQETEALAAYIKARAKLMHALSIEPFSVDRRVCRAISAIT